MICFCCQPGFQNQWQQNLDQGCGKAIKEDFPASVFRNGGFCYFCAMKILRFWKPVLWLIIILILSLIPGNRLPGIPLFPHVDKAVHAAMYFGLALLLVRPLSHHRLRRPYTGAVLICLVIGILVEISQEYMAVNRSGNWPDVAANLTGALTGIIFYHYLIMGSWFERLV